MSTTRNRYFSAATLVVVLLVSGCFQAENPFYRKSDIINDARFEGRFCSNKSSSESYVIKPANEKHYSVTYHDDGRWVEFDAVLFKCGTNLFVDLSKIADGESTPSRHIPGDPVPTGTQIANLATIYNSHFVIRMRFAEDGFDVASGQGNPVHDALKRHRNLRTKKHSLDGKINILTNPTDELYKLLLDEGSNESVFGFRGGRMVREE